MRLTNDVDTCLSVEEGKKVMPAHSQIYLNR